MTKEQYLAAVNKTKEHIQAGDVFQLVLSQRFQRHTLADPFEIYRYLPCVAPDWQQPHLYACMLICLEFHTCSPSRELAILGQQASRPVLPCSALCPVPCLSCPALP